MVRHAILRAAILLLAASLLTPASGAGKAGKRPNLDGEKVAGRGSIDWEKGTLYATGMGAVSRKDTNPAKAYLRARAFARLDALRNLLMVVDHVRIDARTTGRDFEEASDEIRAEVKGILRGAQVVAERKLALNGGTVIEVTVATPMYGDRGIARVFLPEIARRDREAAIMPKASDEPEIGREEPPVIAREPVLARPSRRDALQRDDGFQPDLAPPSLEAGYTSLIVDTRGLNVDRCMSPKLRRPGGEEIWGTLSVNLGYVIEHGIVGYANSLEQARRNARAGANPLIVRAVGRMGGPYKSDPVLTDADAERALAANARDGFLDRFRVIFVVDPGH